MSDILQSLTTAQRDAVQHVDGPLLILAGPGSGKTRVVTHRIAHLLEQGIAESEIAALTFTNKAAEEMGQRVGKLAPGARVWMGTFHRFCAQLLRRYASQVGLAENYSIYDTNDSKQALKRAIATAEVETTHTSPEKIAVAISRAKNRLITPEMMQGQSLRPMDAIAARVYPVYQRQLLTSNAVDFDDLLFHIANLLRHNAELRGELDHRFRYILVDEYQDTNLAQYAIVRALSIDHPNLSVTGDPDQSIYGWRGADIKNILDFEKDYPRVKTVRLEQNFRSTPNILRVADQLIRHNRKRKQKELFTESDEGDQVVLRMFESARDEADSIADEIVNAVAKQQATPNDFAVFCRMNALTRSMEHALRARGVPYQIINGVEFYQRREIKDLLAYLHLINNPNHDVALLRVINVPTRGIGTKSVQKIQAFADRNGIPMLEAARRAHEIEGLAKRSSTMIGKFVAMYDRIAMKACEPLEDLLLHLVEQTGYRDYLEKTSVEQDDNSPLANVDELIAAAIEFDRRHPEDGSLEGFLEQVSLVSDTDAFEETNERVTLMTFHASKGLEFPRVFLIGVEDDLLPHARSKDTDAELEEERRLLFVGITRAKQWLQLSYCKRRPIRGDMRPVIPSPFLNELPLSEMKKIETVVERDWFDSEFDQSYPDSWDLPEIDVSRGLDVNQTAEPSNSSDVQIDPQDEFNQEVRESSPAELEPHPSGSAEQTMVSTLASLKTATDMMATANTPLSAYREGSQVRHQKYGEGVILAVSGRGPKRTARIRFDDGEHNFRLAFADLELVDG